MISENTPHTGVLDEVRHFWALLKPFVRHSGSQEKSHRKALVRDSW